jgi:ribose 5-phosphate isomerase A
LALAQDPEQGKRLAGQAAAQAVRPGMRLGLGTGSTVAHFLHALSQRVGNGELDGVVAVPTSLRTEEEATRLGIPLTGLDEVRALDLMVDGADEVDPALDLIKGMGGALLREKMVAQACLHLLVIVDEGKVVERLGTRSPLPVEVIPFAWRCHLPFLEGLGARIELRTGPGGAPFLTDNGNHLLHCTFPSGIADPRALELALAGRAGVVETGLFLGMAREVLVGGARGVRRLLREA